MVSEAFLRERERINQQQEAEARNIFADIPTDLTNAIQEQERAIESQQQNIENIRQFYTERPNESIRDRDAQIRSAEAAKVTLERRLGVLRSVQSGSHTPQQISAERLGTLNSIRETPSSGSAIGSGVLGRGDSRGTVISTSKAEDQVRSGYYSGTPTLDTRVTDIFAPPPDTPRQTSRGGVSAQSVLPSGKATLSIEPQKIVGVRAGVKSIVPPVQNRELRGSTITAKQFKEIRAGRLTEAEAIAQNQTRGRPTEIVSFTPPAQTRISTRVLGDVLPSSSAFLSLGGSPRLEAPTPPREPAKLTQAQVNNLSDSEYAEYQADFNRYENEYSQYQKQYQEYVKDVKAANLRSTFQYIQDKRQANQELKSFLDETKKQGFTTISINTTSGAKTVPIDKAYRQIQATKNIIGIGAVPIGVEGSAIVGSISAPQFIPTESKAFGPQVGATLQAQKEVERITGLNLTALTPISSRIDAAFELNKPISERSNEPRLIPGIPKEIFSGVSNKALGQQTAPIADFGAAFIYAPIKTTVDILAGKNVINPKYKPGTEEGLLKSEYTPKRQSHILDDVIDGKPVNLLSDEAQAELSGEFVLQVGLLAATKGVGNVIGFLPSGSKISSKIGERLGISATKRDIKALEKAYKSESDVPTITEKTKGGAYEIFRSQETGRGTVSPKIEREIIKISPDLSEGRLFKPARGPSVDKPFEIITSKLPKGGQSTPPPPYKNPQPRVPYAYIEPGKKGTTAEVLRDLIKGPKKEIGAIISSPPGALTRKQAKRLGFDLQSLPDSPGDIYTVKATDNVSKVLRQAEEAGFLKKVKDIQLIKTQTASTLAKSSLKESQKSADAQIRAGIDIAAGRTGPKTKDYLGRLVGRMRINIKEPSILETTFKPSVPKYTAKEARQKYKDIPQEIKFYESEIKIPTTIGYYEIGTAGIKTGAGRQLGARISEKTIKGFAQKGVPSFKVESKGLQRILENVGLDAGMRPSGMKPRPLSPFNFGGMGAEKGTGGSAGKAARLLTKEDEEKLFRDVIPKIAGENTKKPYKQSRIIPIGPTGLIGIQGQPRQRNEHKEYKYSEPLGIVGFTKGISSSQVLKELLKEKEKQKKKNKPIGIFGQIPNKDKLGIFGIIPEPKKRQRQIAEGRYPTNIKNQYGNIIIEKINNEIQTGQAQTNRQQNKGFIDIDTISKTLSRIGTRPQTIEGQKINVITSPLLGQIPAQRTTPVQKTGQIQQPRLTTELVPIETIVPKIPEVPRVPEFFRFKTPKGFGFLIPGGGTGGLGRTPKRRRTTFIASEADPLRAGVLVPDDVTELVSYSPRVFQQIDINLARARRKKGASGGIDAEPYKGFGAGNLFKKNLNIRI